MDVDSETTPRPPKRRHPFPDTDVHIASPKAAGVDLIPDVADDATSVASSELESHKSGQLSPTKQLVRLEDDYHVKFRSLGNKNASIPEDVAFIRDALRDISDGIGILGYTVRVRQRSYVRTQLKMQLLHTKLLPYFVP